MTSLLAVNKRLKLSCTAAMLIPTLLMLSGTALRAQEAAGTGNGGRNDAAPQASQSSSGQISDTQLVGLPLNGRSYGQLATLQAGVSDPGAEQSSRGGGGGSLTISGSRSFSNNFLMDGTNIMNTQNQVPRSAAGVQLGSDSVLQVQVFSTNYGADYGRSSGGVLNSITRSGTENFHGTLFEYLRNNRLDAQNFFDPEEQPFKRNQFGFFLTGPIRKSSTFFMTSFEALRDRLTEISIDYFPDAAAREGRITDAAGNITQEVAVAEGVKSYLKLYPLPNGKRLGRGIAQNRAPQFLPSNENFFVARLDHKISEQDSMFGRYVFDDARSDRGEASFQFISRSRTRQQYLTLVESHIFSPRLLSSLRFGFTRPVSKTETLSAIDFPQESYFVPGAIQFGQIFHPGFTPFGPSSSNPEKAVMNSFQFSGDLLAQKRSHTLKIGVEIHRYQWQVFSNSNRSGVWRFNSLENYLTAGKDVRGVSVTVALPGSDNTKNYRQTLAGLYIQDGYRLTSRLQLNMGLRYEPATLLHDRDSKTTFLVDPWRDPAVQVGPFLAGNPSLKQLSPRLSLTWSPFGSNQTVIRGGFGIYYDQLLAYVVDSLKSSVPFHQVAVRTNFDASPYFPKAVPAVTALNPIPFQAQVADYRDLTNPMVLRYNFALQQQLPGGVRFQVSYVGGRGNHLFRSYEANLFPMPIQKADGSLFFPDDCVETPQHVPSPLCRADAGSINPAFQGGITVLGSDAQSFYNALQVSSSKSFGQGSSVQANYTFSKSVDDASGIGPSAGTPLSGATSYGLVRTLDRGLSDFNIRHRLAINYIYTFPAGNGTRWWNSGLTGALLRGWRLGGIFSIRSGLPFTPVVNLVTPGYLFSPTRANLLPGGSNNPVKGASAGCGAIPAGRKLGMPDLYFDPCVLEAPSPGTLGNLGRNTMISPAILSLDLSLQKEFRLPTDKHLQFRAEIFNLPNRPNFNRVTTGSLNVFTGYPPRLNSTVGIIQSTATTSRQIQFALRFSF